jgi:pyruvate/2-oxoglutarate dehydrogenase complex dihydrolipoamide dehydrogenase (E3) component
MHNSKTASDFTTGSKMGELDFSKVRDYIHRIREEIYHDADRPEIFENMGIDVLQGWASFLDNHTIELKKDDGSIQKISGRKFIIASGSKARIFPIDGLKTVPYLTNESLFEIEELPKHLAILGGGPIGVEMAQAFNRLGSQVTLIERAERIMPRDSKPLAEILQQKLQVEGIRVLCNSDLVKVSGKSGEIKLTVQQSKESKVVEASHVLVATGRAPNVKGLGLENTNVAFNESGIQVNDNCQTTVSNIFAAGDVTGRYAFTHMAEHMAKIAATNALLKFPQKMDLKNIPWTTFTDPELAHVGATEGELVDKGISYKVYRFPYTKVDRALTEDASEGWIRIYAKPFSGKILGADVLGVSAGEIISEYALAMKNGISLKKIADTIHPYPTYGLAARRAADQWYIQQQRPWITRLIQKIFGYRGDVQEFDPERIL